MDANLIGKRLLELRGDTRRELVASRCGISLSALGMYEQGRRIPRDEIKRKLADYYHTTVESIFFAP